MRGHDSRYPSQHDLFGSENASTLSGTAAGKTVHQKAESFLAPLLRGNLCAPHQSASTSFVTSGMVENCSVSLDPFNNFGTCLPEVCSFALNPFTRFKRCLPPELPPPSWPHLAHVLMGLVSAGLTAASWVAECLTTLAPYHQHTSDWLSKVAPVWPPPPEYVTASVPTLLFFLLVPVVCVAGATMTERLTEEEKAARAEQKTKRSERLKELCAALDAGFNAEDDELRRRSSSTTCSTYATKCGRLIASVSTTHALSNGRQSSQSTSCALGSRRRQSRVMICGAMARSSITCSGTSGTAGKIGTASRVVAHHAMHAVACGLPCMRASGYAGGRSALACVRRCLLTSELWLPFPVAHLVAAHSKLR